MWTKFVLIACVTASLGMSQNVPSAAPRVATGVVSFLGVAIQEIDSDRAKALKLPEEAGVEVTRIAPDSPAEKAGVKEGVLVRMVNKDSPADKAGIRAGDVIVRLDDVKVATPSDISAHLRGARGRPVSVSVVRDRKEITVMLAVAAGPDRSLGQWS